MSIEDKLAAAIRPARLFEISRDPPIPEAELPLPIPDGHVLLAVVHEADELRLPSGQALAILAKRDFAEGVEGPFVRAPLVPVGTELEGSFGVWLVDPTRCPALVWSKQLLSGHGRLREPGTATYARAAFGEPFIDFVRDDLFLDWELCDAYDDGTLDRVFTSLYGLPFEEAADRCEELNGRSRVGGWPSGNAVDPPEGYTYALRLGPDHFDCTFGDAGFLHVWLGERDALLMPDSA